MRRTLLALALALAPVAALAATGFTLTSPTLTPGGSMPIADVYTQCGGGNVSPPLHWHDAPDGTRSYAVTLYDASVKGGFWHWIAFDISVGAHGLNADAGAPHSGDAPGNTIQLKNDFGNDGYSGPCPPPGPAHHYVMTVYALNVPTLGLAAHFSRADALAAIHRHTLASATLAVTWGR
ncbi:MAG TPA: YbhB/YbcL family Raf kinase inhibitor-like protein [Rhodanobacteraceae bacterium]